MACLVSQHPGALKSNFIPAAEVKYKTDCICCEWAFKNLLYLIFFYLSKELTFFSMGEGSNSCCLFSTLNKSVYGAARTLSSKQKWNPVRLPQAFSAQGTFGVPLLLG